MKEKLITIRETAQILGLTEKEVIDLAKKKKIPSYLIGGEFLRFSQEEIVKHKDRIQREYNIQERKIPFKEKLYNFFYFNDFYIISFLIILVLLGIILFT